MKDAPSMPKYGRGDIIYFHHIHVDRPIKQSSTMNGDGECRVSVEGKPRRMLVLAKCWCLRLETLREVQEGRDGIQNSRYEMQARPGYVVISLTKQNKSGEDYYRDLGHCLDGENRTHADLRPLRYPYELVCHGTTQKVQKLKPQLLDAIEKELVVRGMGWKPGERSD